jgi:hypothetical protein
VPFSAPKLPSTLTLVQLAASVCAGYNVTIDVVVHDRLRGD